MMIDKQKYDDDIRSFYDLPDNSLIVYYQNPKLFFKRYLEMINPTHIGILWGRKKEGKNNVVRYGRVIIPSIALSIYFSVYMFLYICLLFFKGETC